MELRMKCTRCESVRIAQVSAKCSDLCCVQQDGQDKDGYVPYGMGIGGGDYVQFEWCLECGQMQGKFPVSNLEDAE
jgi:hypothetical protein